MTDRELQKLSRKELLELLIVQGRENEVLKAELQKTKAALEDKRICISEAGSIAEAALKLNRVFEAAEAAAQQYLENVRKDTETVSGSEAEHESQKTVEDKNES